MGFVDDSNNDPVAAYNRKRNSYSVGILVRKYKSIKNGFFVFAQGNAGYYYEKNKAGDAPNSFAITIQENKAAIISLTPGLSYAINNRFQIEAGFYQLFSLSYNNLISKTSVTSGAESFSKTNSVGLNTSLSNLSQLTLGFRILLQKQQKSS